MFFYTAMQDMVLSCVFVVIPVNFAGMLCSLRCALWKFYLLDF